MINRVRYIVVGMLMLTVGTLHAADNGADFKWRGSGGWGVGLPYAASFKPATLRQFQGEIVKLDKIVPRTGMAEGVAMTVRTHNETLTVHLAPLWFLERQDALLLLPGDAVAVSGSSTLLDGQTVIMATAVTRKGKTLLLRDAQGVPVWSALRQQ